MKLFVVLIFAAFTTFAALPQDEQAHAEWMKTAMATAGSLRKNIADKAAEQVVTDAERMEDIFKKSEEFWAKRKTEDAIKWSKESQAAAKEIAAAAKSSDFDKAAAGMKTLMGNCAACHAVHREKLPEGGYKIK